MAISLKHGFTSGKLDGTDSSLVQPSNWNSDHVLAIGSPKLFGRTTAIGATTSSLSGVTQANPGVFTTSAAHNLSVGQLITITGVVGMTQLNGNTYVVNTTPLSTTFTVTFQGSALNTSAYTAYSSGGTVTPTGTGVAEEISIAGALTLTGGVLTGTGGSPGGSNTQIQFNNSSAFGGSANLTWDGTNVQIGATGALRFADTDSSNYVSFQAPATITSNVAWTLPATDGTSNQALVTNGSAVLSWASVSSTVADGCIYLNNLTINTSYTIAASQGAMSVGPITVASGATVTVSSGSRYVVF